jgi:hypothetical protein
VAFDQIYLECFLFSCSLVAAFFFMFCSRLSAALELVGDGTPEKLEILLEEELLPEDSKIFHITEKCPQKCQSKILPDVFELLLEKFVDPLLDGDAVPLLEADRLLLLDELLLLLVVCKLAAIAASPDGLDEEEDWELLELFPDSN